MLAAPVAGWQSVQTVGVAVGLTLSAGELKLDEALLVTDVAFQPVGAEE